MKYQNNLAREQMEFLRKQMFIWWMWAIKEYPKLKVTYSISK